jgi:hypothetical protein
MAATMFIIPLLIQLFRKFFKGRDGQGDTGGQGNSPAGR